MKYNLSTYFILPLVGINHKAIDGYMNSFIERIGNQVYVQCKEENDLLTELSTYRGSFEIEDSMVYTFLLPTEYNQDLIEFRNSRYSKMSDKAKTVICHLSGLSYNENFSNTSLLLLNLYKHPKAEKEMMKLIDKHSKISKGHTLSIDNSEWIRDIDENQFIDSIIKTDVVV